MAPASSTPAATSQLDVVFDGTWLLVPNSDASGNIIRVDVYSPSCGHPLGVYFTNQLNPDPWPVQADFYQLDSKSYTLNIQRGSRPPAGMPESGIDTTINHCIPRGRPIGGNWDLLTSIGVGPDAWASGDTFVPQTTDSFGNIVPCFSGLDAPKGQISSLQTLSFTGVTAVTLLGAPTSVQALLPTPWSGSGTLIFEDEVPYIPTMMHERTAINAMAALSGLDLTLNYSLPKRPSSAPGGGPVRPMIKGGNNCGSGIIQTP